MVAINEKNAAPAKRICQVTGLAEEPSTSVSFLPNTAGVAVNRVAIALHTIFKFVSRIPLGSRASTNDLMVRRLSLILLRKLWSGSELVITYLPNGSVLRSTLLVLLISKVNEPKLDTNRRLELVEQCQC